MSDVNLDQLRREMIMTDKLNAAVRFDYKGSPEYGSQQKIRDFKDFFMDELKWRNLVKERFPNNFDEIIRILSKV